MRKEIGKNIIKKFLANIIEAENFFKEKKGDGA